MTKKEKFEANERREELFREVCYICQFCGKSINSKGTAQLAHRIAKTKANIKKYGLEVINHKLNLVPVCCVEPCNSAFNIGNNPGKVAILLKKIKGALENGIHN